MAFLNNDEGNTRFVIGFKLNTSFANSCQFVLKNLSDNLKQFITKLGHDIETIE